MANSKIIIDDDYLKEMEKYFEKQGKSLDKMVTEYLMQLQIIKNFGIRKGSVSNALEAYISYGKKMNNKLGEVSNIAKDTTHQFLNEIDEKDQYIF